MVNAFIQHIGSKSLLIPSKTYLLACSGGLDSICLGELLIRAEIPFEVAHVNFHLRGKESDGDEKFVKDWAKSNSKTVHFHQAETLEFAVESHISTQMAAREIRYEWFEKIRSDRNLEGIILAHHQDDQIETIFLNLLRGTGIEGLYGMAERRGYLIRPLLPFSREQIEIFAQQNKIMWREDSSNQKTDYKRNKLRHDILPHLYGFSSDSKKNLITSFERLKDTGKAFSGLFDHWVKANIQSEEGIQSLLIADILHMTGAASLIYFWLRSYGFNSDQSQDIYESIRKRESGKIFESGSHLLNIDREKLFLAPTVAPFESIQIESSEIELKLPDSEYEILKIDSDVTIDSHRANAMLDLDRLTFPLTIRNWETGDRFIPLGMKSSKKISDFLIDLKVPLLKKPMVKVLISDGEIAWVIGYRIADWAKTTAATRKILYFKKN
ncbi:MAG: tRNA lysidine(34) synthetase TilS [Algoriphagus sp.]|uniref:tRNA lysidine(34) synthetase TilS n=1 Tax=Algoriphagus sp. TaxID=1872435 RepID=UPI0026328339|nr:tRNA lysidine(34) synthetase TilS [Algoriphagus sp.]MDG1279538.1 tRNA lysidine(34) synthetase TilS [Algoriphagus sp.]